VVTAESEDARYAPSVRILIRLGFFIPLLVCTYLALIPEPPENAVFRMSDVILHGGAFTYLTFALYLMILGTVRTVRTGFSVIGPRVFAVMLGYGLFLEVAQAFVPERATELKDLLVDTAGIAVGLLLAVVLAGPVLGLIRSLLARAAGLLGR